MRRVERRGGGVILLHDRTRTRTHTRAVTIRNEIRWNRLYILCGRLHCVHSNRVHHCALTTMGRKKRKDGKKEERKEGREDEHNELLSNGVVYFQQCHIHFTANIIVPIRNTLLNDPS